MKESGIQMQEKRLRLEDERLPNMEPTMKKKIVDMEKMMNYIMLKHNIRQKSSNREGK